MRNFFVRTRTAVLFVGVMVGGIFLSMYTYAILMGIILFFCLYEYYQITSLMREENIVSKFYVPLGIATGMLIYVFSFLVIYEVFTPEYYAIPVGLVFSFFALELFAASIRPISNIAQNIMGIIYVSIPFATLNYVCIHQKTFEPKLALGILFLVWMNDAAAYVFGNLFGKHKFFERISPKKTLEGFFGSIVGCSILAYIISLVFPNVLQLRDWFILAFIIWISATLGDLVISMFKRSVGIKDTGRFFPGHGGFLDRFDAFIFAVPFAAAYIFFIR